MNSLLLFLVNSTLSLSLLYLIFSVLMRKETFFHLNRMVLLILVLSSLLIPLLSVPKPIDERIPVKFAPIMQVRRAIEEPASKTIIPAIQQSAVTASQGVHPVSIPAQSILIFMYLFGVLVSFLMFAYSIGSVLLLFRKARKTDQNGLRIRIIDQDIPAFSFGRNILVSQHDFDTNYEAIIIHEQSHIRLGHFYDLMLMELVKIIFWFNPLVYRIKNDLKDIHEFQADDHTLRSGIDAEKYQFLIIQKCVGHQKFALANSFNHCHVKNRITMMNKQRSSKARLWKVATFLPLLALLLLFCGRKVSNVTSDQNKHRNQLDTLISDKRLIIKDTSQYSPSFIKGLKEGYVGYESLTVNDDSLIVRYRMNNSRRDTVVLNKFTIPTNLELNKEFVFKTMNEDKSYTLILKRTNFTNLEYQLKKERETIKSGVAILESSFYFGDEMDVDPNGEKIGLKQYIDTDWTVIKVEIKHANYASITYCIDQKAHKFETLSNFRRE